jgi:uncharacterized membrane protein YfcA
MTNLRGMSLAEAGPSARQSGNLPAWLADCADRMNATFGIPSATRRESHLEFLRKISLAAFGVGLVLVEGVHLWTHGTPGAATALIAVLAASTIGSIAGFAFSALCGALLFHLLDSPIYVVQVLIVCSMAMQSLSVASLWRSIDWRSLPIFLAGGVLGIPAGVYLLLHLDCGTYRDVIGALLVAYGGYLLVRRPTRSLQLGPLADMGAGFLSGITGRLLGLPSAFVTIVCGLKGWDKARQRGVYQPFILCMQPITLLAISLMRPAPSSAMPLDGQMLAFIPAALLGTWIGLRIFKQLSEGQFRLAVNALLIVSGVALVV